MKTTISTLAMAAMAVTVPMRAQEARTGVARPDEATITATEEAPVMPAKPSAIPKPSAAIPKTRSATAEPAYGAYVPYTGAKKAEAASNGAALTEAQADESVVTSVVERPGEMREGTLLRARLVGKLSTMTTEAGKAFTAKLVEPVAKDGRVVLPVGSVIEGRVTAVHSGRRISGAAMLHLEANAVVLPDGTRYLAHLQLIDTDQTSKTKVDDEGSIVRRDHPRQTLAAVGLATGGGAAAGAVIGGGVGAAVGAGIGAGAGTILWLKQDRQEVIPEEALLVFSLSTAMPIVPQHAATISENWLPKVVAHPDASVVGDQ